MISTEYFPFTFLTIMRILQDISIVIDLLRVVDKGYIGMFHYQLIIVQDIAYQADQLTTLDRKRWIKLFINC